MMPAFTVAIIMFGAALISLALALHAWPARRAADARAYIAVMLAVTAYTFAQAASWGGAALAIDPQVQYFWTQVSYFGLAPLAPLWWLCARELVGRPLRLTRLQSAALWSVPALTILAVWTNDRFGLMWPAIHAAGPAPTAPLVYDYGPGIWLLAAYSYTLFTLAGLALVAAWRRNMVTPPAGTPSPRRAGWLLLALASAVPFAANVLTLAGVNPIPGLDLTPIALVLTGILAAWVQVRAPVFDPLPVAEHALFDSLSDMVVVLDCDDRLLDMNPAASARLQIAESQIGHPLTEAHPALAELAGRMRPCCEGTRDYAEWTLEMGGELHYFDVRSSVLRRNGVRPHPPGEHAGLKPSRPICGRVLTAREVTLEHQARAAADRRARQMELLANITHAALDTSNMYAMLNRVAAPLRQLFEADDAIITLWDEHRHVAVPVAAPDGVHSLYSDMESPANGSRLTAALLKTGAPLAIDDLQTFPLVRPELAERFNARSCLALPLLAGENRLGAVLITFAVPHAFTPEETALGQQAASIIALVIDKARLYESERWRLAELTALQSISAAVAASLDLQEIFDTAVRLLHETFGYGLIAIYRLNGDTLYLGAQRGYPLGIIWEEINISQGVIGRAVRMRETQFVIDVSADPDFRRASDDAASEICAPLIKDNRVLGVINIENPTSRPVSEYDMRLLQTFANQLAVAVVNAELFAGERTQRELSDALRQVGLALGQTLEFDELLDRMLESLRLVAPYNAACFMMVSENGESVHVARRTGYYQFGPEVDAEVRGLTFRIADTSNLAAMAVTRRPMIVSYTNDDSTWHGTLATQHLHSWAGAPVLVDGRLAAFISIDHCRSGAYTDAYLPALEAFAAQAGAAIRNARLFKELRAQMRREQRLYAATRDFTSRLGEAAVQEAVSRHMTEILQAAGCALSRWEPEADRIVTLRDYMVDPALRIEPAGTAYALADYPVTRQVIATRQPVWLRADSPETDPGERQVMQDFGASMVLMLPLAAGRETPVYGVVELYRLPGDPDFTASELELAVNLAAQAAQAIENARLFAEVQRLAVMDELTGLYNRRGFFDLGRREHERAARYQHALSALFLDIDHFKLFNDAFSYSVGDQALRLVANCMRETTRETDLIGRYGGEEFVALLPETDLNAAMRVAERLRFAVSDLRVRTGWGDVNLTVSIGVYQSNEATPTLDYLIDCAGQSLHTAKEHGRNRVSAG